MSNLIQAVSGTRPTQGFPDVAAVPNKDRDDSIYLAAHRIKAPDSDLQWSRSAGFWGDIGISPWVFVALAGMFLLASAAYYFAVEYKTSPSPKKQRTPPSPTKK